MEMDVQRRLLQMIEVYIVWRRKLLSNLLRIQVTIFPLFAMMFALFARLARTMVRIFARIFALFAILQHG
jgi:hypothetical protein